MPSLQSLLLDSGKIATNRDEILYEIHYRVPRRLSVPVMASHFTQIRRSPEDRYFERARDLVTIEFSHDSEKLRDTLSPIGQSWHRMFNTIRSRRDIDSNQVICRLALMPEDSFVAAAGKVISQIRHYYTEALSKNPALFVFGALEHILDWIARRVTDDFGDDDVLDVVFKDFCTKFSHIFQSIYDAIFADLRGPRDYKDEFESQDFGSVRRWMEHEGHIRPKSQFGIMFDDFRHYEAPQKEHDHYPLTELTHQIRWSRFAQAWNYTFLEFPKDGQPADLRVRTNFLISAILDPSVVNSRRYLDAPSNKHFPGKTLAGAHYYTLEIEDLLVYSIARPIDLGLGDQTEFLGDTIIQRVGGLRKSVQIEDQVIRERARDIASSMTSMYSDGIIREQVVSLLGCCFELLKSRGLAELMTKPDVPVQIRDIVSSDVDPGMGSRVQMPTSRAGWQSVAERLIDTISTSGHVGVNNSHTRTFLGDVVRHVIASTQIAQPTKLDVLRRIADIVKIFWTATFAQMIDDPASEVGGDFVSSAMVEGRCVYFSNFLPFGHEQFTRTIFVDIGMTEYQRARVLQRLNDILTYRSIPIRDLDRVRSAVEALNDLTRTLNYIQMRLMSAEGQPGIENNGKSSAAVRAKQMNELRVELKKILDVSVQTGRLNAFFTYGIAGKWASTNAYYEQILERCDDLREERISGYPPIADFVKRRLRHSIRYVERLHVLHANMGQRIGELLDRVQASLNALQTEHMLSDIGEQVSLLHLGEIVVLVGGSYYLYNLLLPFHTDWVPESSQVRSSIIVVIATVLIVVGRQLFKAIYKRKLLRG